MIGCPKAFPSFGLVMGGTIKKIVFWAGAASSKNSQNKIGINTILYKFVDLKWSIAGPKEDVERANKLAIAQAANIIPTIKEFLGDLTEYYKE